MANRTFSQWVKWAARRNLTDAELPGVYAIAISNTDISNQDFSPCEEIVYFGMTNARGGLKSRLGQFDRTIQGGQGHGGAMRVRVKHRDYRMLAPLLYVAVCPYQCDVTSNAPSDLRTMGEVAKHEYECLADFVGAFNSLPEFNDKAKSPKK